MRNTGLLSNTTLILVGNLIVVLYVFGEWTLPARGLVVFAYLLFFPGLTLVNLLTVHDRLVKVFLMIVLSLSVNIITAEIFLYLGYWEPKAILLAIILVGLLGQAVALRIKSDKTVMQN